MRLELQGVIDQVNAAYIEQGLATAAEGEAAAALIEIDSPGGELTSMDRIIKAMLASEVPVITYVTPEGAQAGSAATFITLAGDVAAMAPSTTIGAASVVGSGGADLPDTLADKINNSNAAKIKDLAAAHDRNTEWAEAAVRDAASVSAAEAVAMDPPVVDLVATDVEDLFAQIDTGQRADGYAYEFEGQPLPPLSGLPIQDVNMSLGQSFLHLLSDPNIAFILFTIGFYGIVSELFHPNFFSARGRHRAGAGVHRLQQPAPEHRRVAADPARHRALHPGAERDARTGCSPSVAWSAIVLGGFALWTGVDPQQDAINVSISPWLLAVVVALSLAYMFGIVRALMAMRNRPVLARP